MSRAARARRRSATSSPRGGTRTSVHSAPSRCGRTRAPADHGGTMFRHRPGPVALLAAAAILPASLLETLGSSTVPVGGLEHLLVVGVTALVAAIASGHLTATAVRRRDAQTALLGTAFSTMTSMLAVHALSTPGVLVGPNGVVALAGGLSLPAGAAVLTLMAVGVALFALLANRAMRTFALTRRADDLVVAVGCAWLAVASVATLTRAPGTAAFYLGHFLEVSGVLLLGVPVALDLRRGAASRPLVGDLSAADVVAAEEAYVGARVRALMVRLAAHDGSTEGHSRRVALLAVQVGEALGLPPATLRHLAVGGLLHDIGKLSVSGAILRKPGKLTDAEYDAAKTHPAAGVELIRELGRYTAPLHALVGEHHERLDGAGYPRGLAAADLEIGPRILAACDVYDALVSDRVYREAWTPERALGLLREQTGTAFDGACVESLARVVGLAPAVAPAAARAVGAPAIRLA